MLYSGADLTYIGLILKICQLKKIGSRGLSDLSWDAQGYFGRASIRISARNESSAALALAGPQDSADKVYAAGEKGAGNPDLLEQLVTQAFARGELSALISAAGNAKLGPDVNKDTTVRLYVRPEHCTLAKQAPKTGNSIPAQVTESAFEGNFINVFLEDNAGNTHMAQVQNDPGAPPPQRGAKVQMNFSADHGMLLAHAKTRS